MRIANRVERVKSDANASVAGFFCMAAACLLAVTPVFAQNERTGVARPNPEAITASPDYVEPVTPPAKPSAAVPQAAAETVYGPYVPYQAPGQGDAAATSQSVAAFDPDANIVTAATAGRAERRLLSGPGDSASKADPDSGIVTHVPTVPGEIPDGTLMMVRLRENLSTLTTQPGTKFSAEVSAPVMSEGRVIVPIGALLEGRVTWVRGGKRIGGPAAIHLEPRTVTLPDGAQYLVHARVIDTDGWDNTKVDGEGTITRRDLGKGTLAAMSLATGGTMAAGAVFGGLPGALIGAGVGAGASTIVWLKQDRQAELPKDLGVVFSLTEPMSVTPFSATVAPVILAVPGGE
jgi:hypothetical protein